MNNKQFDWVPIYKEFALKLLQYKTNRSDLIEKVKQADIDRMVVTMGEDGAIYVEKDGSHGYCPAQKVDVIDTTGAGDSFFAGVAVGLTYGKTLKESCNIGTRLASSVIATKESVCPRFQPAEFGLPEIKNYKGY